MCAEKQTPKLNISPESGSNLGWAENGLASFSRPPNVNCPRVSRVTGSGLGLTLAREVVRLHGGDINVESKLDQGSTFTLKVPVQKKAA